MPLSAQLSRRACLREWLLSRGHHSPWNVQGLGWDKRHSMAILRNNKETCFPIISNAGFSSTQEQKSNFAFSGCLLFFERVQWIPCILSLSIDLSCRKTERGTFQEKHFSRLESKPVSCPLVAICSGLASLCRTQLAWSQGLHKWSAIMTKTESITQTSEDLTLYKGEHGHPSLSWERSGTIHGHTTHLLWIFCQL